MKTVDSTRQSYGNVVFRCYRDRRLPWAGFLVAFVLLQVGLRRVSSSHPAGSGALHTGATLAIFSFAGFFLFAALLEMFRPTIAFEVTEYGIMLMAAGNSFVNKRLFIPWERVVSIQPPRTVDRQQTGVKSAFGYASVIPVHILRDTTWPPVGALRRPETSEGQDTIFLDAGGTTPRGEDLFRKLAALRSQYSEAG